LDFLIINASNEKKVLRKILEKLTFEEFVSMASHWLKSGKLLWYVTGNLDKQSAIQMVEKARKVFSFGHVDKDDLADVRCVALKNKSHYLFESSLEDKNNENSCLVAYFESVPELLDLKTKMTHDVVMQYLDEPCFN
jgi:secreted Zn-dependent insulinase-like peptidase